MMIHRKTWSLLVGVLLSFGLMAQEVTEEEVHDTTCITYALQHGKFHGHFRNFVMATDNANGLTDSWAWASGGGLRYESKSFYHFSVGIGGFFIFNLASSDLSLLDSLTHAPNRYELPLFDVEDGHNTRDIDRLEDLYLRYRNKHLSVIFGKQVINTPYINAQDGRMRPTGVEGAWLQARLLPKLSLQSGWLYNISPRGTVKWSSVAHSIGVYGQGVQPNGQKSDYAEHLHSSGIGLLGLTYKPSAAWNLQLWEQYVDGIFNTAMLQASYKHRTKHAGVLYAGLQLHRQDAIAHGGNPEPQKAYIQRGESSHVVSTQLGYQWHQNWDASLSGTVMGGDGRFLMPREWGREPFYTFLPRERSEGLGHSKAIVARLSRSAMKQHLKLSLAYGYFDNADVKTTAFNKYGLPDYHQINFDCRYASRSLERAGLTTTRRA